MSLSPRVLLILPTLPQPTPHLSARTQLLPEAAALPSGKVMSAHRVIAAPLCALRFLLGLLFLFWGVFFFFSFSLVFFISFRKAAISPAKVSSETTVKEKREKQWENDSITSSLWQDCGTQVCKYYCCWSKKHQSKLDTLLQSTPYLCTIFSF